MSPRTLFLAMMFAAPAWPQADNLVSPEIQPDRLALPDFLQTKVSV